MRPLETSDEKAFHDLFLAVPEQERMFIKHRVTEPDVIRDWCQNIDLGRNLPLLAVVGDQIAGDATLHQQLGGWKRHIGRVSVLVHPQFRGRGLAKALVMEIIELARNIGLEKLEAEFIGGQETAMRIVGPKMRMVRYPAQVMSHSRMRCRKVNVRQGLSTGGVAGVATALTI